MYLRIEEDGSLNTQQSEPSQDDLQQVEEGTLTLVRFSGVRFETAVVNKSEAEGEDETDEWELTEWEAI